MRETWVQSWVGKIPWRRERLPTPVFHPGEFYGLYSPWGRKESDTTERLSLSSHEFSSVIQSCLTLCNCIDCSMPGLPVHHQLLEATQTHIHWVSYAIQPSHPLSSPSPPAFNLSQHQVFSSESVLHIRWPKNWSFSFSISLSSEYSGLILFRINWLDLLAVQRLSRVFSNTIVQKHQFFSAQLSLWSNSHIHTWLLEKP